MPHNGHMSLTIGGEYESEFHLGNAVALLDRAVEDFKDPAERDYIHNVRSRLAAALMYCKNISGDTRAMVKL